MDASFVNPFVQGAQRVFTTVCQETPSLGKIFVKTKPYVTEEVTVSIDIFGAFEGEVVYTMKEDAGRFIVSQMMMGMPVESLQDDMAKSAVCELANIISGNVATIFSGKEIVVDIKPPQLRFGAKETDFPFIERVSKVICIPMMFQSGHIFEVDVMIP
ncbi:MAG: chemotaxis protein CheX [Defluviitaleaceae bacterium]|nr:chemotaxis protein CheX [Defluviitaleaceae bacterium]MCL2264158.1 chemotaxis protein CheX [Defluviitaleaceae bacterium]